MKLYFALLPAAFAFLTACQPEPPVGPVPFDPSPRCGADRLQSLIGQSVDSLSGMRFDQPVRVIHPGMAVTMDYRPDRLNIEVDGDGIITRVWCA